MDPSLMKEVDTLLWAIALCYSHHACLRSCDWLSFKVSLLQGPLSGGHQPLTPNNSNRSLAMPRVPYPPSHHGGLHIPLTAMRVTHIKSWLKPRPLRTATSLEVRQAERSLGLCKEEGGQRTSPACPRKKGFWGPSIGWHAQGVTYS